MKNKRIHTHEERTGEELPTKTVRISNPVRLSLSEFWAIKKSAGVPSWGSVQNNPCTVYQTSGGLFIEEYGTNGMGAIYIEERI